MAIFHMSIKTIYMGKQSVVAAAAYRAGEKIESKYDGIIRDFTGKREVDYKTILLPSGAPERFLDRAVLWNEVEKGKSIKSRLAREIEFALPVELDDEQKKELALAYIQEQFVSKGMIADCCFHKLNSDNPHVHVLLTVDNITNGSFDIRYQKKYICEKEGKIKEMTGEEFKDSTGWEKRYHYKDALGNKSWHTKTYALAHPELQMINRDPESRVIKNPILLEWDNKGNAEKWRAAWAKSQNEYFASHHIDAHVDNRSYKRQKVNILPTIHEGKAINAIERNLNHNRKHTAIRNHNILIKSINESRKIRSEIRRLNYDMFLLSEPTNAKSLEEDINERIKKMLLLIKQMMSLIARLIEKRNMIEENADRFSDLSNVWGNFNRIIEEDYVLASEEVTTIDADISEYSDEIRKREDEYMVLKDHDFTSHGLRF